MRGYRQLGHLVVGISPPAKPAGAGDVTSEAAGDQQRCSGGHPPPLRHRLALRRFAIDGILQPRRNRFLQHVGKQVAQCRMIGGITLALCLHVGVGLQPGLVGGALVLGQLAVERQMNVTVGKSAHVHFSTILIVRRRA